jgi:hypothetical protein
MTGYEKKPRPKSAEHHGDVIFSSIAARSGVLLHPQVTLTCYIPTNTVGAVIGRRGSTIGQIQRHAQTVGTGSIRVSVVGHEDEDEDTQPVPYTYSELDWSSPHWTPVVIRGDPCGALAAGQFLAKIVMELDEVVLDVPLSRTKHAALIGKRGLVLANLSADTQVRIMVPRRELRHDVVQLEGDLEQVRMCLDKVLLLTCSDKTPLSAKKTPTATAKPTLPPDPPLEEAMTVTMTMALTVTVLPSQTKMRNVGRKTDCLVKKKKDGDKWQLIVSGTSKEQIQSAIAILEKWHEDQLNNTNPTKDEKASPAAAAVTAPSRSTPRGVRGGRGPGRKGKKVGNSNNASTKPTQTPEPSS